LRSISDPRPAAIGGRPAIATLNPVFPSQGLPGGAEPDLFACLAALSKPLLRDFMRLEIPAVLLPDEYKSETYPTISTFYAAIRGAIRQNAAEVRSAVKKGGVSNQAGDNIGFSTIVWSDQNDVVDQIDKAIGDILSQGEGSQALSLRADARSECEESHYCKFAQLYYGRQFAEPAPPLALSRDSEAQFFQGAEIDFPEVHNTLAVPADGYAKIIALDPAGADAEKNLAAFDLAYSSVMAALDEVWNGPAATWWPTLGGSVATMAKLRVLGCFNVMKWQIPPAAIAKLPELYPGEFAFLAKYTDLKAPVFYGPRFRNVNA